jgi:hypothetical protein
VSDERQQPKEGPWELAELIPPQAGEDVPWDRPAEMIWPEPELDALTWNERWNEGAYDPDYPLPPVVGRSPARQAVAAAAGGSALRFGRPVRAPDDFESDDPYDENAPVADDLESAGQLTWTGGTVPLGPVASADAAVPPWPTRSDPLTPQLRPPVEPPTWSPTSRSVFGDYFAVPGGKAAPPLPSPERDGAPPPKPASQPEPAAAEEWPPIPTDFQPQWASVAPVQPAWPHGSAPAQPAHGRPVAVPRGQLAWVQSTPPAASVARPPAAPPRPAASSRPAASYIVAPPLTPSAAGPSVAAASLPGTTPLPAVRPVIPPRIAPRPPAPILPDDYDNLSTDAGQDAEDAESEGSGPSTLSTLFWMAVTGVVVVGLVLAFLHFMTGVFR